MRWTVKNGKQSVVIAREYRDLFRTFSATTQSIATVLCKMPVQALQSLPWSAFHSGLPTARDSPLFFRMQILPPCQTGLIHKCFVGVTALPCVKNCKFRKRRKSFCMSHRIFFLRLKAPTIYWNWQPVCRNINLLLSVLMEIRLFCRPMFCRLHIRKISRNWQRIILWRTVLFPPVCGKPIRQFA